MFKKYWYESRTYIVNALAFIILVTQQEFVLEYITPEGQAAILTLANILLRTITDKGIRLRRPIK